MRKIKYSSCFFFLFTVYLLDQVFSESQFDRIGACHTLLALIRYAVLGCLAVLVAWKNRRSKKNRLVFLLALGVFVIHNTL